MKIEYRVVWKRKDCKTKHRVYASLESAKRYATLLGPEPWLSFGKHPDDPMCCKVSNPECNCDGITVREHSDQERARMPEIEYVRIEWREVGRWMRGDVPNVTCERGKQ